MYFNIFTERKCIPFELKRERDNNKQFLATLLINFCLLMSVNVLFRFFVLQVESYIGLLLIINFRNVVCM